MEKSKEGEKENQSDLTTLSPAPKTKSYPLKDILLIALIIIAVISLGLLAVNQFVQWRYSSYLLTAPCDLCRELNPTVESCFHSRELVNENKIKFNISLDMLPTS